LEPSALVGIVTDANHPEISWEDNKPTPQHKISDLQCNNEPEREFKDGDFLMFLMCLPDAKHPYLQGKVTVAQASWEAISTTTTLNKSAQQNWLKKIVWPQVLRLTINAWHLKCKQHDYIAHLLCFNSF
jgi:hypothetical protein